MILATDIGGTNTRIALFTYGEQGWYMHCRRDYASQSFASFDAVWERFRHDENLSTNDTNNNIDAACLALAGPVHGRRVQLTNLPWIIDCQKIAPSIGAGVPLRLINDFAAVAYGVTQLQTDELACLQAGSADVHAARVVLGAGTGCGQALLLGQQAPYQVIATEGGHADFAPAEQWQQELLAFWRARMPRVSIESLLSGKGLVRLYEFFLERGEFQESAAVATALTHGEDAAAVISRAALSDNDALASQALDGFIALYGAHAGNIALGCGASGGVYIAGGIAPKLSARIQQGGFMRSFVDKPPMQAYLERIPVMLVSNPDVGLLGAAQCARQALSGA